MLPKQHSEYRLFLSSRLELGLIYCLGIGSITTDYDICVDCTGDRCD